MLKLSRTCIISKDVTEFDRTDGQMVDGKSTALKCLCVCGGGNCGGWGGGKTSKQ